MSKPVQDQHSPPLQQFLNTIPSPLTTVLVGLGPYISTIRHVFQVVSWKSSWEESWLAIALWWAACLLGDVALRYILPLATLSAILLTRWTAHPPAQAPLITEDTLHQTVSDLLTIHALIPRLPTPPTTLLPVLLRISAIIYIPYLFLTHLVRLRVIIALVGTVLLTWRARWASLIRKGLWRSAYIRWATYRTWAFISGQPLPPPTLSPQSQSLHLIPTTPSSASSLSTLSPTTPTPTTSTSPASSSVVSSSIGRVIPLNDPPTVNSFRFLFTVYENQRWWMGLDFTAALLPGERPSWCSASHQPVAPPSMFCLPSPTTVFMRETLPSPQSKGKGKAKAKSIETRVKRVARWTWEEPEWKVIIHKEGHPLSRVERQLPSAEAENTGSTGSASRLLKAAGKMRQASLSASGSANFREGSPERHRDEAGHSMEGSINGASGGAGVKGGDGLGEVFTDLDGWVYGDNKWEGGSSKGGMGKYTRYRRWTRIAILSETVYPAEEENNSKLSLSLGIRKDHEEPPNPDTHLSIPLPIPPMSASSVTSPNSARSRESSEGDPGFFELSPIDDDGKARLRQRLQAAVKSGSHS